METFHSSTQKKSGTEKFHCRINKLLVEKIVIRMVIESGYNDLRFDSFNHLSVSGDGCYVVSKFIV